MYVETEDEDFNQTTNNALYLTRFRCVYARTMATISAGTGIRRVYGSAGDVARLNVINWNSAPAGSILRRSPSGFNPGRKEGRGHVRMKWAQLSRLLAPLKGRLVYAAAAAHAVVGPAGPLARQARMQEADDQRRELRSGPRSAPAAARSTEHCSSNCSCAHARAKWNMRAKRSEPLPLLPQDAQDAQVEEFSVIKSVRCRCSSQHFSRARGYLGLLDLLGGARERHGGSGRTGLQKYDCRRSRAISRTRSRRANYQHSDPVPRHPRQVSAVNPQYGS